MHHKRARAYEGLSCVTIENNSVCCFPYSPLISPLLCCGVKFSGYSIWEYGSNCVVPLLQKKKKKSVKIKTTFDTKTIIKDLTLHNCQVVS